MKQTAVDWLIGQISDHCDIYFEDNNPDAKILIDNSKLTELFDNACKMMREQIEEAWYDVYGGSAYLDASDYFDKTYKTDKP